mmetsp:Transcript_17359/g.36048  ORF Transcript_17359/g.36048 Transcript_17359/m.36048 type:complete len:142 (-) Transcript_17359:285-710(-)
MRLVEGPKKRQREILRKSHDSASPEDILPVVSLNHVSEFIFSIWSRCVDRKAKGQRSPLSRNGRKIQDSLQRFLRCRWNAESHNDVFRVPAEIKLAMDIVWLELGCVKTFLSPRFYEIGVHHLGSRITKRCLQHQMKMFAR